MNFVVLSIGSNCGDRFRYILSAIEKIPFQLDEISNLHLSEALLLPGAPISWKANFLNIAISGWTTFDCKLFLKQTKIIEDSLFRNREYKWGPRTIDIDIIFWNNSIIDTEDLSIPHPHAHKRDFVLNLICEMYPGIIHPLIKKKVCVICTSIAARSHESLIEKTKVQNMIMRKSSYESAFLS